MILSERHPLSRRLASVLRRRGGLMLAVLVCAALVYVVFESFGFTEEARRAPLVVAVPAGLAALVLVVKELISPTEPGADEPSQRPAAPAIAGEGDEEPPAMPPPTGHPASGVSTTTAVAWVLVLIAMFLLLGLLVTIPLFTVAFMRIYGRERWRTVLLTTVVVFAMVYLFFIEVLGIQVFGGWAGQWLGLG